MSEIFIISRQTKVIATSESNYYRSDILDSKTVRQSIHPPEKILDDSCLLYGANLNGRRKAAAKLLQTNSKLPIAVNPNQGIYMIPTASSRKKDCIYVSYFHIKKYQAFDKKTRIHFVDGSCMVANTSVTSFDTQYKKTSQLIVHDHRDILFRKAFRPLVDFLHTYESLNI